ncbi:MAG: carbamoyltransferase [Desulfobacteraceae bacterium]|nr:carbamoyltransferase [Desulfobacteraceae bacterium]
MIVLGISDSFTCGASVVIDGKVVAAVNEERLDRQKMSMGFPRLSIAEVIRLAGVRPDDIHVVAVATQNLFWRPEAVPYRDYFREEKGGLRDLYLSLGAAFSTVVGNFNFAKKTYYGLKRLLTRDRRKKMRSLLKNEFGILKPVVFLDHHLCHAASAYFTSGFEDATVITQDGAGDGKCSRVYRVKAGVFEPLSMLDSYDSIGNYYSYVTHICGFQAHKHEGKITGLAAVGEPEYADMLRKMIRSHDGIIHNSGKCFDHTAIVKLENSLPSGFSKANLSASIQTVLEEEVSEFCNHWVQRTGCSDLALAGGVFANVKLNQRIHELDSVRNIFVHPGMGDEGLAVGAALFEENRLAGPGFREIIRDVYLGGNFSDTEIENALLRNGLKPVKLNGSIQAETARLLADGKVVARFDGAMEYGPRALGNRTILYQATDPTVNDWLNKRLVRTEFMPFAPVTLWEEREKCYKGIQGAEDTARFMTITFNCTDAMIKSCPAVCHVDNTARPQLIRREDNPGYYEVLKEYQAITGLSTLINTSFNMHEEPIVYTPEDAVRSFKNGNLDALAIGPYLVLAE